MSHTVTAKTVPIKNITCVRAAVDVCKANGCNIQLVQNAPVRMYFDDQLMKDRGVSTCDYVIQSLDPNIPYDVGLLKQKNGEYELIYDDFSHYLPDLFHADMTMHNTATKEEKHAVAIAPFLQAYGIEVAKYVAQSMGMSITGMETNQQGEVVINYMEGAY